MNTARNARAGTGRTFATVWVVAALAVVAIVYATWLQAHYGVIGDTTLAVLVNLIASVSAAGFVVAGALIVSRQPDNVIGWLLIIPGIAFPITESATTWLVALDPAPTSVDPWLWLALWFTSWSWVLFLFPVLHLLLTFPDGTLLSRRWRWAVWLEMTLVLLILVPTAFYETFALADETGPVLWSVANPIGFIPESFDQRLHQVWDPAGLFLTMSSVTALVLRYRRSDAGQRHQIKWLFYATGVFAAGMVLQGSIASPDLADLAFNIAFGVLPISIAVAVLRYRLYEIDRIVSRTVSYALVVAVLSAVFFGVVSLLTSFLHSSNDLAIAGSTLAVFALFNPLRKRVQDLVDRRFNRTRYDTRRVVDGFADTLRDQIDADEVVDGWIGVVNETMQPASIGVWVRDRRDAAMT